MVLHSLKEVIMESIEWYRNKEGLFNMTKMESVLFVFYTLILFLYFILFFLPLPTYQYYVGNVSDNIILFSISKKHFIYLQESELYIHKKKYHYKIVKKEENLENKGIWIITIKLKAPLKEKHTITSMVWKGKKESKCKKIIEILRKELVISPN